CGCGCGLGFGFACGSQPYGQLGSPESQPLGGQVGSVESQPLGGHVGSVEPQLPAQPGLPGLPGLPSDVPSHVPTPHAGLGSLAGATPSDVQAFGQPAGMSGRACAAGAANAATARATSNPTTLEFMRASVARPVAADSDRAHRAPVRAITVGAAPRRHPSYPPLRASRSPR